MIKKAVFISLLLVAGTVLALSRGTQKITEKRIDSILKRMTLREKIGQLFIVPIYDNTTGRSLRGYLNGLKPGGIIILGRKLENAFVVKRVCDYIRQYHKWWRTPVPIFTSINQEGGTVNRLLRNVTVFPSAMAIGATGSSNRAYQVGYAMGQQLLASGINMNYAPVMDINYNPYNQVIGTRAFSDKKDKVILLSSGYAAGLKAAGVIPIGKHFPGHGRSKLDSHWFFPRVRASAKKLFANDFAVFTNISYGLLPGVMTAHVVYKKIDKVPATISKKIITGFFRKRAGYKGIILTDDIFMKALSKRYSYFQIVKRSINAGCDIISTSLPYSLNRRLINYLIRSVKRGKISRARIDQSVRRILRVKFAYGMFKPRIIKRAAARKIFYSRKHKKLSNKVAQEAITLVRDPKKIFPLKKTRSILLVSYQGRFLYPLRKYLLRKKLARRVDVIHLPYSGRASARWKVYRRAARYSMVIYAGLSMEDRAAMKLLARYRKKKIVFVSFLDPYIPRKIKGSYSYIAAFSYFSNSLHATAKAIAGLIPFKGKMPVTIK